MTDRTLLIRGGRVIDRATGRDEVRDVHVAGGRVVASLPGSPDETIDAAGCLVLPGFVEPHALAPAAGSVPASPGRRWRGGTRRSGLSGRPGVRGGSTGFARGCCRSPR